jgi:hypothetical protein
VNLLKRGLLPVDPVRVPHVEPSVRRSRPLWR